MARVSTSMSPAPGPEGSKKPGKPVKPGKKEKAKPKAVAPGAAASGPTSRINIALPFSQIRMQEPTRELAELVALDYGCELEVKRQADADP